MTIELETASDSSPQDKRHRPSLLLAALTIGLLAAAAWIRFGPGIRPSPLLLGSRLPPTRLERLESTESLLLLGLEGKVTWLVFFSSDSVDGVAVLPRLESVWKQLHPNRRFSLVTATTNQGEQEQARTALDAYQKQLPLYTAGHDAQRRFGVDQTDSPWHFLVDPHGRIAAIARGSRQETIDRLAKQATSWLEALEPMDDARFSLAHVAR